MNLLRRFKENFSKENINIKDLIINYSRSSGPGGQNVNKVNTKVELRFPIENVNWLPKEVKEIMRKEVCFLALKQLESKINKRDEFLVQSDRFRTQQQNFQDCINKIYESIDSAIIVPNETSQDTKDRVKEL
jgi:peptidyl-tRNA hydrolase ICT1